MITVYSWPTPNGHKIHIMLEECGLPYRAIPVNIGAGDQFKAEFLKISPNNKIPAIIDTDGPDGKPVSMFESGAILLYLAGKTGKLMPKTDRHKYEVLKWLMFQMGGVGPMLGQTHHFRMYAPEKIEYALVAVAVDRVLDLLGRVVAEVVRLAQHRPHAAHLEHQPLQHFVLLPVGLGHQLAGLAGQIQQNRA